MGGVKKWGRGWKGEGGRMQVDVEWWVLYP